MSIDTLLCGTYKHFKNEQRYEIIGLAHHSETLEDMVVYRALYHSDEFGDNQLWVRPKQMFFEQVQHNGQTVLRFQRIE